MNIEYKIGDTVMFNSKSSPEMVVESIDGESLRCVWIDTSGTPHGKLFHKDMIHKKKAMAISQRALDATTRGR